MKNLNGIARQILSEKLPNEAETVTQLRQLQEKYLLESDPNTKEAYKADVRRCLRRLVRLNRNFNETINSLMYMADTIEERSLHTEANTSEG